MRVALSAAAVLSFTLFSRPSLGAEPIPIKNADFTEWKDGVPRDWSATLPIQNGDGLSRLGAAEGGGIELGGDRSTHQWRHLSQRVAVAPGDWVRLRFESSGANLVLERGQRDNCYIGFDVLDGSGGKITLALRKLYDSSWAPGQIVVQLPEKAATIDIQVFLSKSGTLRVRGLRLDMLAPEESWDVFGDELDRYYSFFALKKVDWRQRLTEARARAKDVKTAEGFVAAALPLLAELRDLHVRVETPDGRSIRTYGPRTQPNFDQKAVLGRLKDVKAIGEVGLTAHTPEGYGYLAIRTLLADQKTTAEMLAAWDALLDASGLILDLRPNSGGAEGVGRDIVSRLIGRPLPYARQQVRAGAAYDDLVTIGPRVLVPRNDKPYPGPVVGLIGPGCVSSCEGLTLMLKALPQATLIGQPTCGASGSPQPLSLPNGVTVLYSTWMSLDMDGKALEGVGIEPAVRIDDDPTGVKAVDAAVAWLGSRVTQRQEQGAGAR